MSSRREEASGDPNRSPDSTEVGVIDELIREQSISTDATGMITDLGPWRLTRELGRGGMGTVWLAERSDGAFRMKAAVKLIRADSRQPNFVGRFRRERQILADLEHPYICRLLDGGTSPTGDPYLVMEYVDGKPLDDYWKNNSIPIPNLLQIFIKICSALSYAHNKGVIHRDLKPGNILVTQQGEPKLLDFGIAHIHQTKNDTLTEVGQLVLTPSYASPEQWRDQKIGPESDVYSLGVMLLSLVSDWAPQKPGIMGVNLTRQSKQALGPELYNLLMRAVDDEPSRRFHSAEAFGAALEGYLAAASSDRFRALSGAPRVFISCRGDVARDVELALAVYEQLIAVGMAPFFAPKSITNNEDWALALTQALRACHGFVLLLSEEASTSEMVTAEFDLARQLHNNNDATPYVLVVRVHFPKSSKQRFPMREHLKEFKQIKWRDSDDTQAIVADVLANVQHEHKRPKAKLGFAQTLSLRVATTAGSLTLAPLERPGDLVRSDSPYYVRPMVEDGCIREVLKPGSLIRIKGPRQMGKTSLMMRLLSHAGEDGTHTVAISLQMTDRSILGDLDHFLRWLCAVVSRRMKISTTHLNEEWEPLFGSKDNCTAYFEEHLLCEVDSLVLALDHLDRIFDYPDTAEEFLALLRAWHEMGKNEPIWQKLRLVLVHATEMYLPMNINHSPFNVGLSVSLSEWKADTVFELAKRHGLELALSDVDRLMSLLNGHPHLTRLALYTLANGTSIDDIMTAAATDEGLFADHLKHLLWHLHRQPEIAHATARVMAATEPVMLPTELAFKLASLGLVHLQGNAVMPARDLYRRYLGGRLHLD